MNSFCFLFFFFLFLINDSVCLKIWDLTYSYKCYKNVVGKVQTRNWQNKNTPQPSGTFHYKKYALLDDQWYKLETNVQKKKGKTTSKSNLNLGIFKPLHRYHANLCCLQTEDRTLCFFMILRRVAVLSLSAKQCIFCLVIS